ncbi:ankyrin repeat-containing domain protein [Tuber borchii]|uniref:Ankyrin repeat-containing domain protein n=1 Tax=Tuber borchii TaxID=42251 RepID=A0A2T7A6Q4_TUBBO|nr:ankyrin repeat-containing domain protein [Tuber borchii]
MLRLLLRPDVDPNLLGIDGRTPLSLAVWLQYCPLVKILLGRGDVNPNSPDWIGRTPLSLAAGKGSEGIVKLLLERWDVNPDSVDRNSLTPLAYATRYNHFGTMRLLSKARPSSHETSENSGVVHQTSVPALSTQDEMGLALLSQQAGVIPDAGRDITEVIPLRHSDDSPSNQLEPSPLLSVLTSTLISDTSPKSTTLNPSRPLKRPGAARPLLEPSKRKRLPSS